jgi:hypothetical protein
MLLSACCTSICGFEIKENSYTAGLCPPLPDEFQESDLYGTWSAEYGAATDVIEIREDGTYRQMYIRHSDGYEFENSGNQWWLESRDSGGLYLHLEGMRRCDSSDQTCYDLSGGGGGRAYWDFCEDRLVTMPDEVIVMVTGVADGHPSAPRGIWLWHMAASRETSAYHFVLQEQ